MQSVWQKRMRPTKLASTRSWLRCTRLFIKICKRRYFFNKHAHCAQNSELPNSFSICRHILYGASHLLNIYRHKLLCTHCADTGKGPDVHWQGPTCRCTAHRIPDFHHRIGPRQVCLNFLGSSGEEKSVCARVWGSLSAVCALVMCVFVCSHVRMCISPWSELVMCVCVYPGICLCQSLWVHGHPQSCMCMGLLSHVCAWASFKSSSGSIWVVLDVCVGVWVWQTLRLHSFQRYFFCCSQAVYVYVQYQIFRTMRVCGCSIYILHTNTHKSTEIHACSDTTLNAHTEMDAYICNTHTNTTDSARTYRLLTLMFSFLGRIRSCQLA